VTFPTGVGAVIAVIVVVLAVVFAAIGQMDLKVAVLITALGVARLT